MSTNCPDTELENEALVERAVARFDRDEPWLDSLQHAAGSGRALVYDQSGIVDVVDWSRGAWS